MARRAEAECDRSGRQCKARIQAAAYLHSRALQAWLAEARAATIYVPPGMPWENPYSESFNGRLRDEFLDREEFTSVAEAKVLGKTHWWRHNHARPHRAPKHRTPAEFAAVCRRGKGSMARGNTKTDLKQVAERLPATASYADAMYELSVRMKIAHAKQAADEGRVIAHEEVKRRFTTI